MTVPDRSPPFPEQSTKLADRLFPCSPVYRPGTGNGRETSDLVAVLEGERVEAHARRDRHEVDRLSWLIAQLTTRQARRLVAVAHRAVIETRLHPHELVVTDDAGRTADVP